MFDLEGQLVDEGEREWTVEGAEDSIQFSVSDYASYWRRDGDRHCRAPHIVRFEHLSGEPVEFDWTLMMSVGYDGSDEPRALEQPIRRL